MVFGYREKWGKIQALKVFVLLGYTDYFHILLKNKAIKISKPPKQKQKPPNPPRTRKWIKLEQFNRKHEKNKMNKYTNE